MNMEINVIEKREFIDVITVIICILVEDIMKKIVISGINLSEGGPLTIYKECLGYVQKRLLENYEIVALVHDKELFSEFSQYSKNKVTANKMDDFFHIL